MEPNLVTDPKILNVLNELINPLRRIDKQLSKFVRANILKLQHHAAMLITREGIE
ncbi:MULTISPECIES: hypothetical protein [unclassified Nostoc]|uniref:hypothetical protein n=1 Tax=unclassified Nostoc TaxID=2593658 RepID=UPI00159F003B|nr:hypothetical protein [Nostoc sp. KVJ20]